MTLFPLLLVRRVKALLSDYHLSPIGQSLVVAWLKVGHIIGHATDNTLRDISHTFLGVSHGRGVLGMRGVRAGGFQ